MDLKTKLQSQLSWVNIDTSSDVVQKIIANAFLWTGTITAIVFIVAYYVLYLLNIHVIDISTYKVAYRSSFIFWIILLFVITWYYEKFNYAVLAVLALLFSISEWIWLAGILSMYSASSVINAFVGAAVSFLGMAFYGYTTKRDISSWGSILLWWLIWLIVLSLINAFFLHSSWMDFWLAILWLVIFLALTAWDLQVLKMMAQTGDRRFEIVFGISLFLDFINIFIELLRIFGSSDD